MISNYAWLLRETYVIFKVKFDWLLIDFCVYLVHLAINVKNSGLKFGIFEFFFPKVFSQVFF